MLKFAKSVPYLPDPIRSRPNVSAQHRELAAATPPHAVPHHCKPWVDGQSIGWTLSYGFFTSVTVRGIGNGKIAVDNLDQLAKEAQQPKVIDQFAAGHFGISSGYTFQTPPGMVSLLIPATTAPAGLSLITGVIETDWYPRQIFLVYQSPPEGVAIELEYQQPIARVVLVPRHEGLQAEPIAADDLAVIEQSRDAYVAEEAVSPTRWQDADGQWFTNVYKLWSRAFRQSHQKPDQDNE